MKMIKPNKELVLVDITLEHSVLQGDFLNRNKYYLNNKSKKIMTSNKSDVHNETSKIFRKHKKFNNNEIGKIISKELNKLRKMRNQADYNQFNNNIDNMIKKSKIRSERILKLLKKLN